MSSRTGLNDAIRRLDVDAVRAVLADRPELARAADADGQGSLHRVARILAPGGDAGLEAVAIAELLLAAGAEVDAVRLLPDERRPFEATPLWYAVEQGRNRGVIALLLARGADPERVFWSVCFNEDLETADSLVAHGLDVERPDIGGRALVGSLRARKARAVDWLLANGAPVDGVDELGRGPLHQAVLARVPMARLEALVHAGADPSTEDRAGATAADLARAEGRTRVAALLDRLASA